jgi:hypothetical protein
MDKWYKNVGSGVVEAFKSSGKLLKGKEYRNCLTPPTDIIISIILSNVIPHILKHEKVEDQSVTLLYERIGKIFIREYYKVEYRIYKEWVGSGSNNSYNLIINRKSFVIEPGLAYPDFISELSSYSFKTYFCQVCFRFG